MKHSRNFAVNYSFTFTFLALGYVQFEAKFTIVRFINFHKVR